MQSLEGRAEEGSGQPWYVCEKRRDIDRCMGRNDAPGLKRGAQTSGPYLLPRPCTLASTLGPSSSGLQLS